jgi:ribosomal subunit interface protein
MNINIKATNIELTEHLTDYIHKKLDGVEKFVPAKDPTSIRIYMEIGKTTTHHQTGADMYRAEINLKADSGYFRAVKTGASPDAAVDMAKDEIVRELTGHADKQRTLLRRGGAAVKNLIRRFYQR